ncbi:hypothetical protein PG999_000496 [Apiospora kogelbergensis]|uniref:CBM11 domain-containing protein n=1 Tax=Apiospora kogelbergensis TaxID=1337665 RepID=A0AAW0RC01_9PEZI
MLPTGTASMSETVSASVSFGTDTLTQSQISSGVLPPFTNASSASYPATGSIGTAVSSVGGTASVTATVSITSTAVISSSGPPTGPSDTTCSPTTFSASVISSSGVPDDYPDTTCTTSSTPTLIHLGNNSSVVPTQGPLGGGIASLSVGGTITGDASAGAGSPPTITFPGPSSSILAVADPTDTVLSSTSSIPIFVDPTRTASSYYGSSSGGPGSSSSSGDSGTSSTSSAPTCTPTQGTVMIDNGGFERGLGRWQVGAFQPLMTDYYITDPEPGSGSAGSCRSLAVWLVNGGWNWGSTQCIKFALANQARVEAELDGVTVASVVAERGADNNGNGHSDWTQWGVVFKLGARRDFGALRFKYFLNGAPENTIWIDAIDIAPYVAPLSANGSHLAGPATPSSQPPLADTAVLAVMTTKAPGS